MSITRRVRPQADPTRRSQRCHSSQFTKLPKNHRPRRGLRLRPCLSSDSGSHRPSVPRTRDRTAGTQGPHPVGESRRSFQLRPLPTTRGGPVRYSETVNILPRLNAVKRKCHNHLFPLMTVKTSPPVTPKIARRDTPFCGGDSRTPLGGPLCRGPPRQPVRPAPPTQRRTRYSFEVRFRSTASNREESSFSKTNNCTSMLA